MYISDFLSVFALAMLAMAVPTPSHLNPRAVAPQVKSVRIVANVTDPSLTRDSCSSTRMYDRALWTCRDTEAFNLTSGQAEVDTLVPNSASWTNLTLFENGEIMGPLIINDGPPGAASTGGNPIHEMYASSSSAFFEIQSDECGGNGVCSDGTRWALWPDQPPMVAYTALDGALVAYTWIKKDHLSDLLELNPNPPISLYKTLYTPSANMTALPDVQLVDEEFWLANEINYGDYGNVVHDGMAYLYGQTNVGEGTVLARVNTTKIEDKSAYEYYVNEVWTPDAPGINSTDAIISNAGAGGQGTFYYSTYYESYIWIGAAAISGTADFFLTTAPSPEGPWIEPYSIYEGTNGNSDICASYTLQAQPALLPSGNASENAIYLSWTMDFQSSTYGAYVTPLAYVEFE